MQAVILAGGKGERLGALAAGRAKPLLDAGGKPFIRYLLDNLRRFGFDEVVILAGPFADAYREWLGDAAVIVPDAPPAGTAGALARAAPHLGDEFLLLNGDSWFDFNWLDLAAAEGQWLARLALRAAADAARYGAVKLAGDRVAAFAEKGVAGAGLINGGVTWMKRAILDEMGAAPLSLERDVLPKLAARGLLAGAVYDGRFIDIGVPDDLARAKRLMPDWERRPAAFLDRDGVINLDTGYVHRPEDFVWRDGAQQTVKRLNDAGYFVFVVTNQAGIARGYYEEGDVERLHHWVNRELRRVGAHVDRFYFCPHHPEGIGDYRVACKCRKPEPGLLLQAIAEWPVEIARSFMVGDKDTDVEAAAAAGIKGALIRDDVLLEPFVAKLIERGI